MTSETVKSVDQLREILERSKVNTNEWTKSVNDLYDEIHSGESSIKEDNILLFDLSDDWKGDLVRKVRVAIVTCAYECPESGEKYELYEDKQVLSDGTIKRRGFNHISEKKKKSETSVDAAKRGLSEELGINEIDNERLVFIQRHAKYGQSQSYPGIDNIYVIYEFLYDMEPKFYREEYVEVQKDKSTYFKWRKIEE